MHSSGGLRCLAYYWELGWFRFLCLRNVSHFPVFSLSLCICLSMCVCFSVRVSGIIRWNFLSWAAGILIKCISTDGSLILTCFDIFCSLLFMSSMLHVSGPLGNKRTNGYGPGSIPTSLVGRYVRLDLHVR